MLYFITALYAEAKPLLQTFSLKKNTSFLHSTVYENETITLLITGVGKLSAAIAVTELLALKPPAKHDILCNIGIAACPQTPKNPTLFFCTNITDFATARTVYPDMLFPFPYEKASLITVDCIITSFTKNQFQDNSLTNKETIYPITSSLLENEQPLFAEPRSQQTTLFYESFSEIEKIDIHLYDMEAYGIYTAALRYFSCERMFFFKAVSDSGIENQQVTPLHPDALLAPYYTELVSLLQKIETILANIPTLDTILPMETQQLSQQFADRFSCSVSMQNQLKQLVLYSSLLHLPINELLQKQLDETINLTPTKKEGKKQIASLQKQILQANLTPQQLVSNTTPVLTEKTSLFSAIYVEQDILSQPLVQEILHRFSQTTIIPITHYKDVFNRSHQNSFLQKEAPSLILAQKQGTLLYAGAPVCQSFGNAHFYYTSCSMNCPYDCEYCYLQGMYPSSHLVLFVNIDDYFSELDKLLAKHPIYLCASYDTDLLALHHLSQLAVKWAEYVQTQPNLTIELRTKSANLSAIRSLPVCERLILAWTLSPDCVIQAWEHKTPSLIARLKAARLAKDLGFPVRLCFDPLLYFPNYEKAYALLFEQVFTEFSPEELYDISIGVFRCSKDFIKLMRKKRPASALLQYPYENENGVYHYGIERSNEMLQTIKALLLSYQVPEEKIFLWNPED